MNGFLQPVKETIYMTKSAAGDDGPVRLLRSVGSESTLQALRREGELWTIEFAHRCAQLHDLRGLHYIALLLRHPHREFHALELVHLHHHGGEPLPNRRGREDFGDWLDAKAKSAYKQQLIDLRHDLETARRQNDLGQIEHLEHQIQFFAREIARSIGLFGRTRRTNAPAERARVNVSRAIRAAVRRLAHVHPAAGDHFDRTIKTGTFCSYNPDPRSRRDWKV